MNEDVLERIKTCIADKAADFFGSVTLKLIYRGGKLFQINVSEEETLRVQGDKIVRDGK